MSVRNKIESTLEIDAVLSPYLQAGNEADEAAALEHLICERAQPVARQVLRAKLRVGVSAGSDISEDQATDLLNEITLRLLQRLRSLQANADEKGIANFRGYVAVTAYHACDGYLRKKYPRRYSLKNQTRYILTHRAGLAVWESSEGDILCGAVAWKDDELALSPSELQQRARNTQSLVNGSENLSVPDLVAAICDGAGGPLRLDDLVSLIADLRGIKDVPAATTAGEDEYSSEDAQLDSRMDQRGHLERLWGEIRELPLRQRVALLMSLRDTNGRAILALLPLIQIASIRQIAETLAMPAEKLAALWNQLPLSDAAIAESLGVTRQQVVNLRKCARERLWRRTRIGPRKTGAV
jgi:DNA-directed RNA polymerase specialized sigma24 family protein